jgi:DNA-binding response OmpR family regulator
VKSGDATRRVLIIDSDNVRRGMFACTLPASDFSLEFARTIEKGLDLVQHLRPDVVIVGRDGLADDLCQRIRSLPVGNACTLVLMDERFRDETVGEAEAEALGADTFIPFPCEAALFQQRLNYRRRSRQSEASPIRPEPATALLAPQPAVSSAKPQDKEARDDATGWAEFRQRVFSIHHAMNDMDYYELLQVPPHASPGEIKTAYFSCSMAFHPDRFMQLNDEELKRQIYEIFKRMSEAFKVLINPEIRSHYDTNLSGPERARSLRHGEREHPSTIGKDPVADASTPAGKRYLNFALLAESQGNLRSARMYLSIALQCEPQNSALRTRFEAFTRKLES